MSTTAVRRHAPPGRTGQLTSVLDPPALIAEFFGTFALVFFAVGVAVFAKPFVGALGLALTFGLVLVALVYAIGPISGCHVNPAVTLGMVLARRISPLTGLAYWFVQIAGGLGAAGLLAWLANSVPAYRAAGRGSFGTDGYDAASPVHISAGGAFLAETVLTALLVFVVLCTTHGKGAKGPAGMAIGFSLAVVHLIGIPLTGTSVNPARALGPAVFADTNAMSQVWLFLVAPLAGAVIAVVVHLATHGLPGAQAPSGTPPVPATESPGAGGGGAAAAAEGGDAADAAGPSGTAGEAPPPGRPDRPDDL